MKPEYTMLSLLIPGPQSPGNDIDVYLQPLIQELKDLWEFGVETYDALVNETFLMRFALLWTINDYPGYAMLSSWSTKGRLACAYCNYDTNSSYLKHSHKMCYMNHHVFLPMSHPWRSNKKSFNGKKEFGSTPHMLEGPKIVEMLKYFINEFGKNAKKTSDGPWKKRDQSFLSCLIGQQINYVTIWTSCILRKTYVIVLWELFWIFKGRQKIMLMLIKNDQRL